MCSQGKSALSDSQLWDTYLSAPLGLALHTYVCLSLLMEYHEQILEMEDQELNFFLRLFSLIPRKLPVIDVDRLIAKSRSLYDELKD